MGNLINKLVIYGAGGAARELIWVIDQINEEKITYDIVCCAVDEKYREEEAINDIPVLSIEDAYEKYPDALAITATGNPELRSQLASRAKKIGYKFATIRHPKVYWSKWNKCGEGSFMQDATYITTNVEIGRHVYINGLCSIGHDVKIGDFCTIGVGSNISGWVHIEDGVYIGTGAVILEGTKTQPLIIGRGAIVGASACVTRSVEPGITVVGVPAKPLSSKR